MRKANSELHDLVAQEDPKSPNFVKIKTEEFEEDEAAINLDGWSLEILKKAIDYMEEKGGNPDNTVLACLRSKVDELKTDLEKQAILLINPPLKPSIFKQNKKLFGNDLL